MNNFHFRAIASLSVIDVTTTLTHDIEKVFNKIYILTVLIFNIQRVFE